jgi:hypothetical protein
VASRLHQQRELPGFHADQEAARILGESIDYSRQAQALALRFRAPAAPSTDGLPRQPIIGVTPTAAAPTSAPAVEAPAPAPAPAPANDAAAPADPATPRPAADADATP